MDEEKWKESVKEAYRVLNRTPPVVSLSPDEMIDYLVHEIGQLQLMLWDLEERAHAAERW